MHGGLDAGRGRRSSRARSTLWSWTADDVYLLSGPAYHAGPGGFAMTALAVGATIGDPAEWDAGSGCGWSSGTT